MDAATDALEEFGMTRNEARVYAESLKIGAANASTIADRAHLPRTTVNSILKSLKEKGMVQYTIRSGARHFSAVSARVLLEKLHNREQRFCALLPTFEAMQKFSAKKPAVEFYEGLEGFKSAAEDMLLASRITICGFVAAQALDYVPIFHSQFRRKRKERHINIKMLTEKTPLTLDLQKQDREDLRETRFTPLLKHGTVSLFMYGNKTAYFLATKITQFGVIIENKEIAEFNKRLFEQAWNSS